MFDTKLEKNCDIFIESHKVIRQIKNNLRDKSYLDARLLLSIVMKNEIYGHEKIKINNNILNNLKELIRIRVSGITISRILGKKEFWSENFYLNSETLDPRPDSELIVRSVLDYTKKYLSHKKTLNIIDLGTGSGCLILSLLKEEKKFLGVGTDISPLAIAQARANASLLNLSKRVEFFNTNWSKGIQSKFDIIISNPPYIKKNEKLPLDVIRNDPKRAIFSGTDGLDSYREIFPATLNILKPSGKIFLEIGKNQEKEVISIAYENNFKFLGSKIDVSGVERCLIFKLF